MLVALRQCRRLERQGGVLVAGGGGLSLAEDLLDDALGQPRPPAGSVAVVWRTECRRIGGSRSSASAARQAA